MHRAHSSATTSLDATQCRAATTPRALRRGVIVTAVATFGATLGAVRPLTHRSKAQTTASAPRRIGDDGLGHPGIVDVLHPRSGCMGGVAPCGRGPRKRHPLAVLWGVNGNPVVHRPADVAPHPAKARL